MENLSRLKKTLASRTETAALDLLGEIVSAREVSECIAIFTTAYGKNFAQELSERVQFLFTLVLEERWTKKRFIDTAKWIVKNKPFANWTIADFFAAPTKKLFTHDQYIKKISESSPAFNQQIQWYDVDGIILWAYKKDGDLPFKKHNLPLEPETKAVQTLPPPPEVQKLLQAEKEQNRLGDVKSIQQILSNGGIKHQEARRDEENAIGILRPT